MMYRALVNHLLTINKALPWVENNNDMAIWFHVFFWKLLLEVYKHNLMLI